MPQLSFHTSHVLQIEEATVVVEDNTPVEACSTPGVLRNLSAWSITIPYVDEVNRERVPVFCIEVERNDRKEGEGTTRGVYELVPNGTLLPT